MFWCIMNLISRDQIYIAWSCDLYDLIMWPTLYIAQSCAFNARSCYIYIYFLILWPIPPDLVTFFIQFYPKYTSPELVSFITWSCDLYPQCCVLWHPILWPLLSKSCDKYRPILNLLYNMVLILIGFVTYIAQSCDLYRPILWPILPKFPHAYWLMMSDLVTFKSA